MEDATVSPERWSAQNGRSSSSLDDELLAGISAMVEPIFYAVSGHERSVHLLTGERIILSAMDNMEPYTEGKRAHYLFTKGQMRTCPFALRILQ